MKKLLPHSRHEIIEAIAATVLLAACIHLSVALISTLATGTIDYINPVDFLGFGLVAPQLLHSKIATIIAWVFLIGTGYAILRMHTRLRITISIKKHTKPARRQVVLEGEQTDG